MPIEILHWVAVHFSVMDSCLLKYCIGVAVHFSVMDLCLLKYCIGVAVHFSVMGRIVNGMTTLYNCQDSYIVINYTCITSKFGH